MDDAPPPTTQHVVRSPRTGRAWAAAILFVLVPILLLIFILNNGPRVKGSFLGVLGFDAHTPLAVVAGTLLVAIPGVGRMFQLRRVARRHRNVEAGG